MDGIIVFVGIGAGIGVIVGIVILAPLFLIGRKNADPITDRLAATVPIYDQLDTVMRKRLAKQVAHFIKHKRIIANTGDLPDIMRIAVAGNACMLRLGKKADCYPDLQTVCFDGQASPDADLNISWVELQDAMGGGPHNPVVRACARHLQQAQPTSKHNQGAMPRPAQWWDQWRSQQVRIERAGSSLLARGEDFFASACEAYFQQPETLRQEHPALYDPLRAFFAIDPGGPRSAS